MNTLKQKIWDLRKKWIIRNELKKVFKPYNKKGKKYFNHFQHLYLMLQKR